MPPRLDSRTSRKTRLTPDFANRRSSSSTSARPSPCLRHSSRTAKFSTSASSATSLPKTKPVGLPARSLISATAPGSGMNSTSAWMDQFADSRASRKSALAAAASSARNSRTTNAPSLCFCSPPMACRRPLPENLRVRSPHVVRVQFQGVSKLPFPRALFGNLSDLVRQVPLYPFHAIPIVCARFPAFRTRDQIRVQRYPRNPFAPRFLGRHPQETGCLNHHLLFDPLQPPILPPVHRREHLPALRVIGCRNKWRLGFRTPRYRLQPGHSHHLLLVHFRPRLHRRQPHSHPSKRPRPRTYRQQVHSFHSHSRLTQARLHRRQQPRGIVLAGLMPPHRRAPSLFSDRHASPPLARIYRQRNHFGSVTQPRLRC